MPGRRVRLIRALCGLLSAGAAATAFAHHAFIAQYDESRPASLRGVVVKVEWLNPHAYFYVDVTEEATGEIVNWACELSSPVVLMRRGWTRNSLQIGAEVTVEGPLARDGSASLSAESVVLAETGTRLFFGTNEEQGR